MTSKEEHRNTQNAQSKLLSRSYVMACVANFFFQFARYVIEPILALYIAETWGSSRTEVGWVLAGYAIATLMIRPFCGYMVDRIDRKRMYLIALLSFSLLFAGYPIVRIVGLFALLRILHGLSMGVLAVSANTIVIDISPSDRRGEALGYYGIMNNFAMAIGPAVGFGLHHLYGYDAVFYFALLSSMVALIAGNLVQVRIPRTLTLRSTASNIIQRDAGKETTLLSLDRFILLKGLHAGFNLFLLAIPYGMIMSYIALYCDELGLSEGFGPFRGTGLFFLCMAVGIILSRMTSGRYVDRGHLTEVISIGTVLCSIAVTILSLAGMVQTNELILLLMFNTGAFLCGFGYGLIFPAMNTLFVNLAYHNQRGTASATYMTTWDIGIGLGMLIGGVMGDHTAYSYVFASGAAANLLSWFYYERKTRKHYLRNRLEGGE